MTDKERDPIRQHNGETINQLCKLGDEILKAYLPPDWTKERWIRAMAEHRGEDRE